MLPKSLQEFQRIYSDRETCVRVLARYRWPNGFRCESCGNREARWILKRHTAECCTCERQISLTVGTLLERSRIPLIEWLSAVYIAAAEPESFRVADLYKRLGTGSYNSAQKIAYRIREAMRKQMRSPLSGTVEVSEIGQSIFGALQVPSKEQRALRLGQATSLAEFLSEHVILDRRVELRFNETNEIQTLLEEARHKTEAESGPMLDAALLSFAFRWNALNEPQEIFEKLLSGLASPISQIS